MDGMKNLVSLTEVEKSQPVFFECNKHGRYNGVETVFRNGAIFHTPCPKCADEEYRQETELQKEHQLKKIKAMNIEPEFYSKTFDDFIPRNQTQEKALDAVKKMVEQEHGKVILLGSNGVGKTMLASIATKILGGKIYSMYEISTMIRQSYTVKAERSELEIVRELASVPFLAIDELGRTKCSETEQNWLSYVLDKRHTRNLPFMLMSNGHFRKFCKLGGCPKCFENFVDNDILSRLRQDSTIVVIEAPDERAKKR